MNITNEQVAHLIEWTQTPDGSWLNTQGRPMSKLPDFLRNHKEATVCVVGYFINWIPNSEAAGRFYSQYREDMTAREICELALTVLREEWQTSEKCFLCGGDTDLRYQCYSEEIEGRYCEKCDKTRDWETGEWEDGDQGCEEPWYGTEDGDLWGDDDEDNEEDN